MDATQIVYFHCFAGFLNGYICTGGEEVEDKKMMPIGISFKKIS